jgi:hypothetical protein
VRSELRVTRSGRKWVRAIRSFKSFRSMSLFDRVRVTFIAIPQHGAWSDVRVLEEFAWTWPLEMRPYEMRGVSPTLHPRRDIPTLFRLSLPVSPCVPVAYSRDGAHAPRMTIGAYARVSSWAQDHATQQDAIQRLATATAHGETIGGDQSGSRPARDGRERQPNVSYEQNEVLLKRADLVPRLPAVGRD